MFALVVLSHVVTVNALIPFNSQYFLHVSQPTPRCLIQPSGPTGAVQLVIYLGPFNPLWLLRRPFVVAAVVSHCGIMGVFLETLECFGG